MSSTLHNVLMSNIYKINISTVKHQYQQTRNIGSTLPPRNKLVSHWIMPYSHCWPKNLYPLLWIQLFNIRKLWNLNYMLIEIKNAYRSPAVFLIHSYLGPQVGFICPLPVWALAFDRWLWHFSLQISLESLTWSQQSLQFRAQISK